MSHIPEIGGRNHADCAGTIVALSEQYRDFKFSTEGYDDGGPGQLRPSHPLQATGQKMYLFQICQSGRAEVRAKGAVSVLSAGISTNILNDDQFSDAHDLVRQTVRVLDDGFDTIVRTTQLVGESVHTDELSEDFDFWHDCAEVKGRGYRDRINGRNRQWFEEQHPGEAEARAVESIKQKWSEAVDAVRGLLAQG
jgi:hypothetical protein